MADKRHSPAGSPVSALPSIRGWSSGAQISIIEFVDRSVSAKGQDSGPVIGEEQDLTV